MNERLNMIVLTRPVIILGRNRILMKYQIKTYYRQYENFV